VGVGYHQIDTIFVTHCHSDHISELGSFLHVCLGEYSKRKKGITIYGPVGLQKAVNSLVRAFSLLGRKHPDYQIKVKEIKDGGLVRGDKWSVKAYKVFHVDNMRCLAYRIQASQRVLAYSGDTDDCPGLRKTCHEADLAIMEAGLPKSVQGIIGHLTSGEAGQIANDVLVKKLVLTHISAERLRRENPKSEAKEFFKGPVVLAKDLMKIKV